MVLMYVCVCVHTYMRLCVCLTKQDRTIDHSRKTRINYVRINFITKRDGSIDDDHFLI